jgi:hypothetical protein
MNATLRGAVSLLVAMAIASVLGLTAAGTASAQPPNTAGTVTAPLTGTVDGQEFTGEFVPQEFRVEDGTLMAVGEITETGTAIDGQTASMPVDVQQSSGSCDILNLVLGPLDLDLLGLQVHLDTVNLDIVAQSGPGNLLGNLLCAVAGLLDGPTGVSAILDNISRLLNRVLGLLG